MGFPRTGRQPHLLRPGGGLSSEVPALRLDTSDAIAGSVESIGAGATRVLSEADDGKTFYVTGNRTFEVPASLDIGFMCAFVSDGGTPTITAGAGLTFLAPASATPPYATSEDGVTVAVYKFAAARAQLEGALA
jgi:hypothetical protein